MNIQLQASSLFFLLLMLYFYKRHGDLGLYLGKLFQYVIISWIMCLFWDILSIVFIVNQNKLPGWLVNTGCKIYCISLVVGICIAFFYVYADTVQLAKANLFMHVLTAGAVVISVLIFVLPIYISYDGCKVLYTYGPSPTTTYTIAIPLSIAIIWKLIVQGKNMNPKRRNCMSIWMAIWITAVSIQFFNKELLLIGFAGAAGIMILFFSLENPENYINRNNGFFNVYAFTEFIKQNYRADTNFCGILISLENSYEKQFFMIMDEVIKDVTAFIQKIPNARIFGTDEKEFVLTFDTPDKLKVAQELILERFQKPWLENNTMESEGSKIILQPYFLVMPSMYLAENAEEMLGILKYYRLQFSSGNENHFLVLDDDFVSKKQERKQMIETIHSAIQSDCVEVFYQPIYSIATKKFASAEALVRIRKEDGSIIPPYLFIPLAEETGLITKIGEIVFDKTCRLLTETDIVDYGIEYIEVNLSVLQCENESLAENYINIMKKYQLQPKHINLEITESAAINKKDILIHNMETLIDYGVTFSLDDFGSGQSNLNYIVDMPVHIVKFDRNMTQAYFNNAKAQFVVRAAVDMIQNLDLKIVSEGVETASQLDELSQMGIDYIQGFYFSKPIAASEFIEFIHNKNQMA